MTKQPCKVYALYSSRNNEIRYIGQTTRNLNIRLRFHIKDSYAANKDTHKGKWIRREVERVMKISEIISKLQEIQSQEGDLEVFFSDYDNNGTLVEYVGTDSIESLGPSFPCGIEGKVVLIG